MNVLAISAHPDDETLGCGGTLLAHRARGDEIHWLVMTEGPPSPESAELLRKENEEVDAVSKAYGFAGTFRAALPATLLDTLPLNTPIQSIRGAIERIRPEVVYVVHPGDIHTDHAIVFKATSIVLKTFYMRKLGVRRLECFECLSSTDAAPQLAGRVFLPTIYRDISPYLERKLEIMSCYRTQLQADLMPRSASAIRALARLRGSSIGVEFAECFQLIREVA